MTEKNQNALNEEYDEYITRKYQGKIKDGNLEIGNSRDVDQEITNLRFLEQFDIQTLKLYIISDMSVKLRNYMLKELYVSNLRDQDEDEVPQRLNMQVDDLELENLELLDLKYISLENNQLNNLAKFKKLHTLDVSRNNVGLTHIHSVTSLTKLSMSKCELKNIDLISSLDNLEELDLSSNILDNQQLSNISKFKKLHTLDVSENDVDLTHIHNITSLTKLSMRRILLFGLHKVQLVLFKMMQYFYIMHLYILQLSK
ncbi:Conserved_hypothetical protein [Hexamita inflata]|uniref:Uncharacterized protein n=1 Tax=Hexamita inflata TaxID=28002 RepID=A0AA86U3T3_9EUKA|nr:Conserved hypothetical protein [Hexamita inflata]